MHFFRNLLGQWTQNIIKARTSLCRRTQHIQRTRMIAWHYRIRENECPAHISNTQHPVHMKNDVFKHLVVFQKPQYLQEGKRTSPFIFFFFI